MSSDSQETVDTLQAIQNLLQQGHLTEALEAILALPTEQQAAKTGLYMRGVCERHLRAYGDAEKSLLSLVEQFPSHGRGYQELGHLYRDVNKLQDALGAYATACHLNPALKASWENQQRLLEGTQHRDRLNQVSQRLTWLAGLPGELLASLDLLHEGRLWKSEQICRRFYNNSLTTLTGCEFLLKSQCDTAYWRTLNFCWIAQ